MPCDALYLHIPFCRSKCPYCDFYSLAADPAQMDAYLAALLRTFDSEQLRGLTERNFLPLDTVYFGGGTPSAFGGARLARLLEAIERRFGLAPNAEITVECNPCSADADTLAALLAAGVNRLSFGLQSGSEPLLRRLGRAHTRADAARAVNDAQRIGFSHISLDLMLATPGQTLQQITDDVAFCAQLGAEHISAYLLKLEPGTPFAQDTTLAHECPDEDTQATFYLHAIDALTSHQYRQYEISNFCRESKLSRHNYKYWDAQEYLGLGPAAHSLVDGKRFFFPRDLASFCAAANPLSQIVQDGTGGDLEEYLMLRLRLNEGVVWETLAKRFPDADANALRKKARPLEQGGFVVVNDKKLSLTATGMLLSNAVTSALLD